MRMNILMKRGSKEDEMPCKNETHGTPSRGSCEMSQRNWECLPCETNILSLVRGDA